MNKTRKVTFGFILLIAIAILEILSFINYMVCTTDAYGFDLKIVICYIAMILVTILALLHDIGGLENIMIGLLIGLTIGAIVNFRFTYFATGVLGISQDGISMNMVIAIAVLFLIMILNVIDGFLKRRTET